MQQNTKDWFSYIAATLMLLSSIILSFFSFFMLGTVVGGVLAYVAEAIAFAGGIYGIGMYIKSQFIEVKSEIKRNIKEEVNTKFNEHINNKVNE